MDGCMSICLSVYLSVCLYVCMCVYIYIYMRVCVCLYLFNLFVSSLFRFYLFTYLFVDAFLQPRIMYWCSRRVRFSEVPEKVPEKVPEGSGRLWGKFREALVQAPT